MHQSRVYPGWTQIDLLVHVGSVHRRTTETGIDEFAALWSGSVVIGGYTSPLCLRATDGRQSWRLAPAGEGISFERGEGTESVSGTAATLYLWLLGRASLADLDTSSDAEAWQAAIKALPDARR
jgi:hypothetical protein